MNGEAHRPYDVLIAEQIAKIADLSASMREMMAELEATYGERPDSPGVGFGDSL